MYFKFFCSQILTASSGPASNLLASGIGPAVNFADCEIAIVVNYPYVVPPPPGTFLFIALLHNNISLNCISVCNKRTPPPPKKTTKNCISDNRSEHKENSPVHDFESLCTRCMHKINA